MLAAIALASAAAWLARWVLLDGIDVASRLWQTRQIPEPAPHKSWILGHIPELLSQPLNSFRVFQRWAHQHGPIYRMRFLWRPMIVISDPDLYQPLLRPGPSKLQKYTAPYRMFEVFSSPPQCNMLSSAETPTWKSVRRAAVAALTMNNLRLCFPHITMVTQRLIESLQAAGPTAVQDIDLAAQQVTVDVIGLAAFDRDLQATLTRGTSTKGSRPAGVQGLVTAPAPDAGPATRPPGTTTTTTFNRTSTRTGPDYSDDWLSAFLGHNDKMKEIDINSGSGMGIRGRGGEVVDVIRHLVVAMQQRNNPLNRWFPWRKAYRDLRYYAYRMSSLVVDLLCDMERDPPPQHTLGAHLMRCKHQETGEPLDRVQLASELGLMWGAGFETTAHTICWTLFLVATHPEVESAVMRELASLGLLATPETPTPQRMEWEHLAQLKYLSAVLQESMRLFPVVSSGTVRITYNPITLGGYHIPAGQPILIPFWTIHRNPKLWTDPESFKPERWLSADSALAAAPSVAAASTDPSLSTDLASNARDDSSPAASVTSSEADYVKVTDADTADDDVASARDQDMQTGVGGNTKPLVGTGGKAQQDNKPSSSTTGLELKDPTINRRGFLPFSEGTRNCVGQALALVELKAVLGMLLGHFHFELAPEMGGYKGVEADARQAITLRPQHGLLMTAGHRSLV